MRRLALTAVVLAAGPAAAADYPAVVLRADGLSATVYLPDARGGFYRSTRFDWAGLVGPVEFAGHRLFAPWKPAHDPLDTEAVLGPAEEFGTEDPPGYADAAVGQTFLKVGVGELVKPKEDGYRFWHRYEFARPGPWQVTRDGDRGVRFAQAVDGPRGLGYRYDKRVSVGRDAGGPTLTLAHKLDNTGTARLRTDVYNHHFVNVDGDPVGPNYELTFPFRPVAADATPAFRDRVRLDGRGLTFAGPLADGAAYAVLTGFAPTDQAGFVVRHKPSGVTLSAAADHPIARCRFWAVRTAVCPEPFHVLDLKPGASAEWAWVYRFAASE